MSNDCLKELRSKKRYTQVKGQMLTGIDQSDYSKIEKGIRYPTVEQSKRLAMAFDTSVDYILGLTDTEKPYPRTEKTQQTGSKTRK
jgi:transcriptional regulator with XRE-family HTH domain